MIGSLISSIERAAWAAGMSVANSGPAPRSRTRVVRVQNSSSIDRLRSALAGAVADRDAAQAEVLALREEAARLRLELLASQALLARARSR